MCQVHLLMQTHLILRTSILTIIRYVNSINNQQHDNGSSSIGIDIVDQLAQGCPSKM